MPRPKVKPENRQRCVIACGPCKKLKVRCDAATPCSTCVRRGREPECVYEDLSDRPARQSRRRSTISSTGWKPLETPTTVSAQQSSPLTPGADHTSGSNGEVDEAPKSRMLLNSKFQNVYLGEMASLSYLQFLRQIVQRRVGPCRFTEGEFNNFMLESEVSVPLDVFSGDLSLEDKHGLVRWYTDATSGILDLCQSDEVLQSLDPSNDLASTVDIASAQIIFAIGAQCRGSSPAEVQIGKSLFARGQMLAFAEMLCDASIDMVRQFLLMSFYMLAACHRNAAFMYLGVATKAALAVGLHRVEHYSRLDRDECSRRLKTWKSLRVLDTIVNSILGRQGGLSGLQHDPRLDKLWHTVCTHDDTPAEIATHASFDMCPFMDELERKGPNQDVRTAQDFLQRLQSWSKALPKQLRRATDTVAKTTSVLDRELHIGGLHVACFYYFAVMLATRRFFTVCILAQLRPARRQRAESPEEKEVRAETEKLGQVCLDAAISLAKISHDALASDRIRNNMCILKAWLLATGLILGLSLFAQTTSPDYEVQEALHNVQEVLGVIAKYSPQATHYHSILSSLSEAIGIHQRRHARERKRVTGQYLDQIFTSEHDKNASAAGAEPRFDGSPSSDGLWNSAADPLSAVGDIPQSGIFDELDETLFSGELTWSTDDFAADWQPFSSFSEDVSHSSIAL